jgi:ATP phosphoribosyltransferase regulatory subunit HisZ
MTTISPQISFPVGVRSLLLDEARRRRAIEADAAALLIDRGYDEIILPIVDFVEPYRDVVSERTLRRSYRFTDREGELLTVRSDFTPMVARVVAPLVDDLQLPLRLFYRGDVIRYEPSRLGRNREFFQIGGELVGTSGVEADLEIIALAHDLVAAAGRTPVITITDASLPARLLRDARLDPSEQVAVLRAIRSKRAEVLKSLEPRLRGSALALLELLVDGSLRIADLEADPSTAEIGLRLSTIADVAAARGIALRATLDEIDDDSSYYTGIRFAVFSEPGRTPLGGGGRYDSLYARFGSGVPAVGFTINLDSLEERP